MFGQSKRRGIARLAALPLVSLAAPISAQSGATVDIEMSSFKYKPESIQLVHGRDYVLHFVNTASGGHDFSAPAFFTAAKVTPEDRAKLKHGALGLGGGEEARIRVTAPAAGHYTVRCTHFMHSTFGMTGEIVVI